MPSIHHVRAWIAVEPEEWRRFLALGTVAGIDGAHFLAELVRAELARQGVQLVLEDQPALPAKRRRSPASSKPSSKRSSKPSSKRSSKATSPVRAAEKPAAARRRRKLPVVSDELVEREARRGAAAAKRSRRRGTIAVDGGDRHDDVIAKANKRSPAGKEGRPTRRRS